MSDTLPPAEIEALAWAAGLTMAEVCRRAGLAQSTFTRWKAGKTAPTLDVYRKLLNVVRPTPAATPKDAYPMPDSSALPLGVHDRAAPFHYEPGALDYQTNPQEAEAAQIFGRINRELAAEEARADRLMRFYNL